MPAINDRPGNVVVFDKDVSTSTIEEATLQLCREQLNVHLFKKQIGIVRVSSVTSEQDHEVNETLTSEHVEVVTVPIGRIVDAYPPVRIEGDTTILSIVEEVLVVERRLVLREEVHMTKMRSTVSHRETVTLREQRAVISHEQIRK